MKKLIKPNLAGRVPEFPGEIWAVQEVIDPKIDPKPTLIVVNDPEFFEDGEFVAMYKLVGVKRKRVEYKHSFEEIS